eukprot:COSAG04_NODE_5841_length_1477_cov_2.088534_1_plen_250_part_10
MIFDGIEVQAPAMLLLPLLLLIFAPADGGSPTPQHCAASSFGALTNCTRAASQSSSPTGQWTIAVRGSIDCPAHGCDTLVPGHGGQQVSLQNTSAPVLLYGAGPAGTGVHSTRAVLRRSNFTAPLLTIGFHRAPVRITGISFEDPQRGDCWAWDRCDVVKYGSCESQVVLMDAEASVHFEVRCHTPVPNLPEFRSPGAERAVGLELRVRPRLRHRRRPERRARRLDLDPVENHWRLVIPPRLALPAQQRA